MKSLITSMTMLVCWTIVVASAARLDAYIAPARSDGVPAGEHFRTGGGESVDSFGASLGVRNLENSAGISGENKVLGSSNDRGLLFNNELRAAGRSAETRGFPTTVNSAPVYEDHLRPLTGAMPVTATVTRTVTKTHTLRIPSTSDVWVTSITMKTIPVTQLRTVRQYVPNVADTVTSAVRVTHTNIEVLTRTVQIAPTRTQVSVFTLFRTVTKTNELWQPIVHLHTKYEVHTVPVLETQTLVQVLYTTVTATRTAVVTSYVQDGITAEPRAGGLSPAVHTYGY